MMINMINREDSKKQFEQFVSYGEIPEYIFDRLNKDYLGLRKAILKIEETSKNDKTYMSDLQFALKLYAYLNSQDYFNYTIADNVDFWRYLCVCVVPDLIMRRHGLVANYFYQKSGRIYLQAMWWFIHMSYQGDSDSTYEALKRLNTDYILQFVERQGRDGFYLEVSREIIRVISKLPAAVVNKKIDGANLFRRVLIQNTAKQDNYNLTTDGKTKEYVNALFKACKVEVSDYE